MIDIFKWKGSKAVKGFLASTPSSDEKHREFHQLDALNATVASRTKMTTILVLFVHHLALYSDGSKTAYL